MIILECIFIQVLEKENYTNIHLEKLKEISPAEIVQNAYQCTR